MPKNGQKKVILGFRWEQNKLFGEVFDYSEKILLSLGVQSGKVVDAENPTQNELQNLTSSINQVFTSCTNAGYLICNARYLGPHRSAAHNGSKIRYKGRMKSMTPTTDHILEQLGIACKAVVIKLKPKKAIPRTGIKKGKKVDGDFLAASRYLIATHLKNGLSRGRELAVCAALELGSSKKNLGAWVERIEKARARRTDQTLSKAEIQHFQSSVFGKL